MVRLFFATSFEIYSASQFYLSLVTGLDVTQNISTAESPDTLYATCMKPLIITLFSLCLIRCTESNNPADIAVTKSIHIPDTTNNWYAKSFDYDYYLRKKEISKQLQLVNLEDDTLDSEIRVWVIGSNYNPQTLYSLKNTGTGWGVTKITYYVNFNDWPKLDSLHKLTRVEKLISQENYDSLGTENIWQLLSQGEMKDGQKFGCVDGYALLIEISNKSKYKFTFHMCPEYHKSKDSTFQIADAFNDRLNHFFY